MRWHSRRLARHSIMVEDDDSEFLGRKLEGDRNADYASANDNYVCYFHGIILAKRWGRCLGREGERKKLKRVDEFD